MSAGDHKQMAADRAAGFVEAGMRVGLGTGSTAALFVQSLARRIGEGLDIVGIPTSEATRRQAWELGIPLATLDECPELDLTVDGADEIGPGLTLVKGGGGALLREKLVAAASRHVVIVADEAKLVRRLGRFPVPVELVPFGFETTRRRLTALVAARGLPTDLRLRTAPNGRPFVTDNGGWIIDLHLGRVDDAAELAAALKATLGVVEHGLFVGLATVALIGTAGGVNEVRPG